MYNSITTFLSGLSLSVVLSAGTIALTEEDATQIYNEGIETVKVIETINKAQTKEIAQYGYSYFETGGVVNPAAVTTETLKQSNYLKESYND